MTPDGRLLISQSQKDVIYPHGAIKIDDTLPTIHKIHKDHIGETGQAGSTGRSLSFLMHNMRKDKERPHILPDCGGHRIHGNRQQEMYIASSILL